MPTIKLETQINAPIECCFDLARNVDIHRNSVMWTQEHAVAGVTTGLLQEGDVVTWQAIHFGVRQRLTVKITEFERPYQFVDELVQGVFKELRHVHEFAPSKGGTCMVDIFEFKSPLGVLGLFVDKLLLTRYMRAFLRRKNGYFKEIVEAGDCNQ